MPRQDPFLRSWNTSHDTSLLNARSFLSAAQGDFSPKSPCAAPATKVRFGAAYMTRLNKVEQFKGELYPSIEQLAAHLHSPRL